MIKVALIGHDTRNPNLGVGALTVANAAILRAQVAKAGVEVEVTALIGASDAQSCIPSDEVRETIVRPLRKPMEFLRHLRAADVVVDISGGDSFADIYGDRRIFQTLLQRWLTHVARRPLVVSPQTIGPFKKAHWRRLAAGTLSRSAVLCTRDEVSADFMAQMGVRREVIVASDVALKLPFDAPPPRTGGPVKVGLNVSALLMAGGYTGKNMFGLKADYGALIHRIVARFLEQDNCELHLVGHVIPRTRGGVEDDYQASLDLAASFPDCIVAPAFETPSEAKSYIAGLDFFMGARMHACIAAFSSGVPVVPMAYSRKFAGLFGALGYTHIVDCTSDSPDAIETAIFAAYDNRVTLAKEMVLARDKGLQRLSKYEDALSGLFTRLG
ncbi:MAG: polysaccharide pyruvyl transferase family protein [Pseudomonadota bacterium]